MLLPYYRIFGRVLPAYGIWMCLGVGAAAGVALLLCRRNKIERFDVVGSAVYTMIGALLGAKLLFIAVSLPQIMAQPTPWKAMLMGGFVFYGGLILGTAALWLYCRQFRLSFSAMAALYATVLPLGHAFGRVGCFFGGCCYGIPFAHGIVYTASAGGHTPLGVPLLPIQLIEAAGLLLIFSVNLIVYLRTKEGTIRTVWVYFLSYAPLRFVLEFFRGDAERGLYWGLSCAQWISLLFLFCAFGYWVWKRRKRV